MSKISKKVLAAVDKMPAFPKSVHQVLTLTADINCSQKDLVEVIKNDPVFTMKILRMVNSAYFGLAREVTSINQASVYLGLNTLKNVALGLAAIGSLPNRNDAGFDMNEFWLHSLAVAGTAKMLGASLDLTREEAGDYFAAGLLHDIGKVVFALCMPEDFRQALDIAIDQGRDMLEVEEEVIGFSHDRIGFMLAEKWNLPNELRLAIAGHHYSGDVEKTQMVDCVFTADQVAKKLEYGFAGNCAIQELPERVREIFSSDLDGVIAGLTGLEAEIEKARIFIQLGGES